MLTGITAGQITTIVILVLIAGIGTAGYVGYRKVKRKVTDFSRAAFGTDDLIEGWNKQADELATTPKSVASMTRLFEPQIAKDFPDFSWNEFKHKAENMLVSALLAIDAENTSGIKEASPEVVDQVKNIIIGNQNAGVKEVFRDVRIHQTEISNYKKEKGTCTIVIQSAVEFFHYKEKNQKVIEGDKERKTQTKYNVELIYIQDESVVKFDNAVGTTCPNCGAPIKNLGSMVCEYCGSGVVPINIKVWSLHKFYEVDYKHV